MSRIEPITERGQVPEAHRPVYDAIASSRGRVAGPFAVLLHSPELADRIAHLGALIRYEAGVPDRVRELATCAVGRELDALYVWSSHVDLARKAGVPEATLVALREGRAPTGLPPEDAQVVVYVQALLRAHRVSDAAFRALEQRFGAKSLLELTATVGYYSMMAAVLNGFEMGPEAGADLLPVPAPVG